MDYGIWTLLPIVVVVAVALKSRRALEPLILGTLLTYIIVDGLSFPIGWMDAFSGWPPTRATSGCSWCAACSAR